MTSNRCQFTDWLLEELGRRGWQQGELTSRGHISSGTLTNVLSGRRKAGPQVCRSVAAALDLPQELVFRKAGLLDDPAPEVPEEGEILRVVRRLPAAIRRTAVNILRALDGQAPPATYTVSERQAAYDEPRTLTERMAYDIAQMSQDLTNEEIDSVFDRMKQIRGDEVPDGAPVEPNP